MKCQNSANNAGLKDYTNSNRGQNKMFRATAKPSESKYDIENPKTKSQKNTSQKNTSQKNTSQKNTSKKNKSKNIKRLLDDLNWDFSSAESQGLKDPITRQLTIVPIKPTLDDKMQPIEKGALMVFIGHRNQLNFNAFHPLNPDLAITAETLKNYVLDTNYIQNRNRYLEERGYTETDFLNYRNVSRAEYDALTGNSKSYNLLFRINAFLEKHKSYAPYVFFVLADVSLYLLFNLNTPSYESIAGCYKSIKTKYQRTLDFRHLMTYQFNNQTYAIKLSKLCTDDYFKGVGYRYNPFTVFNKIDFNSHLGFQNATFPELVMNQYIFNPQDDAPYRLTKTILTGLHWLRLPAGLISIVVDPAKGLGTFAAFYLFLDMVFTVNLEETVNINTTIENVCNRVDISFNNQTIVNFIPECTTFSQLKGREGFFAGMALKIGICAIQYFLTRYSNSCINRVTNFFNSKFNIENHYYDRDSKDDKENKVKKSCTQVIRQRCIIM